MKADSFTGDDSQPLPGRARGGGKGEGDGGKVQGLECERMKRSGQISRSWEDRQTVSSLDASIAYVSFSLLSVHPVLTYALFLSVYLALSSALAHPRPSVLTCVRCCLTCSSVSSLQQLGAPLCIAPVRERLTQFFSIHQHLLSERSLSAVRWCWEQPSLYPPSQSEPPCFPSLLLPPPLRACN